MVLLKGGMEVCGFNKCASGVLCYQPRMEKSKGGKRGIDRLGV